MAGSRGAIDSAVKRTGEPRTPGAICGVEYSRGPTAGCTGLSDDRMMRLRRDWSLVGVSGELSGCMDPATDVGGDGALVRGESPPRTVSVGGPAAVGSNPTLPDPPRRALERVRLSKCAILEPMASYRRRRGGVRSGSGGSTKEEGGGKRKRGA